MLSESEIEEIHTDLGASSKGRDKCRALFHRVPVPNPQETIKAGYPVSTDEIWCRRFVDDDNIPDGPILTYKSENPMDFSELNDKESKVSKYHCDEAKDDFRVIWPKQWAKFLAGDKEQVIGWRLESFFAHEPSRAVVWKHFGIIVVEQLADAPDHVVGKILGGQEDREKARKAIDAVKGIAPVQAVMAKQTELEARLAEKDEEVAELKDLVKRLVADREPKENAKPAKKKRAVRAEEVKESLAV